MVTGYEYSDENNRNTTIVVGTSAVKVCDRLPKGIRKVLSLGNESTAGQIITLGFGNATAVNNGIPMRVGGKWTEVTDSGYEVTSGEVWAISSGAGAILTIYERQKAVL